ncbi:peroxisomal fatty acid beta-oxidation multifunctional protein AIM1 isoform X2 [Nicotiana tabacum]|uniref:Peroxisomal fatty acid beta-oxidation multifunctional protein AIM1 isoform X2 n=1 Tax=Nicotiana tabacum TaxID=4097 RepID=A0AC58TMV6_TOBAC|nr:peroxisomal fatty acid beta-oxidation multifunctional protein isoform X2 [Nicotiana tomentosiformis]
MAEVKVTMEVGSDGVAVITISNPPVNALAIQIFAGLKEKWNEAAKRNDVKAIVLTGHGGRFSGGFDINVFQKVHTTGDISLLPGVSVDLVVNTMEDGKKPAVAAVEGLCLGGGLELALGCHARIAAPRAQLGLPELSLGVLPGSGGTQRLPRLIGLSKAIEMMMTSKPIMSEEGKKLGLIDAIVPPTELLKVARQWALDIAERRKPWMRSLHRTDKIGSLSEAREVLKSARQQVKQTARNMPQHLACLDVIEEGIVHGGYNGVLKEAKVFEDLVLSDTSRGLVHVFFAQRATSKVPNVTDIGLKPRPMKKVAIIGGGLMGSGIATALVLSNIFVILKEINPEYLQKGIKAVEANIRGLVARKKLQQDKANKALSIVKGVLDYSEFKDVDMVIEAVIENFPLKQQIFSDIEKVCPSHCILATNTSTIDLNLIGEKTRSQDRIIGAHFFRLQDLAGYGVAVATGKEFASAFPDRTFKSPLLDLLIKSGRNGKNNGKGYYIYKKGEKPKPDPSVLPIIEESRRLTNIMPGGKPLSVTDQEIVEMILFPVVNEACRVLEDGVVVRASDLDVASVLGMSFPSYRGGIVFWADTVGAGHIYKSLKKWSELYGNFFKPSRFLEERAANGIPLSAPASTSSSSRSRM